MDESSVIHSEIVVYAPLVAIKLLNSFKTSFCLYQSLLVSASTKSLHLLNTTDRTFIL
jgi:hypothetical protein